jgi:hypothetical protein
LTRAVTLAGLLLAALATCAVAQKDKGDKLEARKFATPKECFEAFDKAMTKRDARLMVGCMTPAAVKKLAIEMAVYGISLRAKAAALDKKDELVTMSKPFFDVLDRHGLTEKAIKGLKIKGYSSKEDREAVLKLVKDVPAFAAEFKTVYDEFFDPEDSKDQQKAKLADLKVDGDKATAIIVVTSTIKKKDKDKDETKEEKFPILFEKHNGGWLLDPEPATDEAPAKDKAKDKKKDEKEKPKQDQ